MAGVAGGARGERPGARATSGRIPGRGEPVDSPRAQYLPESATCIGTIRIEEAGNCELTLRAEMLDPNAGQSLTVSGVELTPFRA